MLSREDLINTVTSILSQAPVAGYTDYPFRKIIRELGCDGLIFTEMISGTGFLMNPEGAGTLLKFDEEDRPIGIQIFGNDPENMGKTATIIEKEYNPDVIDINMGCPARKVTKKGGGAALLNNPQLAEKIICSVLEKVTCPVTFKTRIGWANDDMKSKPLIDLAEKYNLPCVFLHIRSKASLFSGKLEIENYKSLFQIFKIPIILNGGIFDKNQLNKIQTEITPPGIMIGRGSIGNPWIFSPGTKLRNQMALAERIPVLLKHFNLMLDFYPEKSAIHKFRKFYKPYLKGLPNHTHLIPQLVRSDNPEYIKKTLYGVRL